MGRKAITTEELDHLLSHSDPLRDTAVEQRLFNSNGPDCALAEILYPTTAPTLRQRISASTSSVSFSLSRIGFAGAIGVLVIAGAFVVTISQPNSGNVDGDSATGPAATPPLEIERPVLVVPGSTVEEVEQAQPSSTSVSSAESEEPATTTEPETTTTAGQNGPAATTGEPADEQPSPDQPCTAEARTLLRARAAYERSCDEPRADCDQIGNSWLCSSEAIVDGKTPPVPTTGR